MSSARWIVAWACLFAGIAFAADDPYQPTWQEVAPQVHVGMRLPSPRVPVVGNTVIVIGKKGVLLFDGGGFAAHADAVLKKVKSLTGLPVTHIVISHWHGDHHLGIHRILETYPEAQVISHAFTARALQSPLMDYIKGPQKDGMVATKKALEGLIASGKDPKGKPLPKYLRDYYADVLAHIESHDREARAMKITLPTRTFEDRITIDLGGRNVELRHLGAGNTKGDIVLWLPNRRIVATGDLVVRPTPYGFNSDPRPWAATLKKLKQLDATLIIPGHGKPMRRNDYIKVLIKTLTSVQDQVDALAAKDLPLDEVRKQMDWSQIEPRFTKGDGFLANRFEAWFKTPIVQGAYNAATGVENESLERVSP